MQPELSVVIPAVNGLADIAGCLDALRLTTGARLEVIVADRTSEAQRWATERDYPEARLIRVPPGTTIPAMREAAMRAATAPAIAVIEDHVIVPPGWARAMLDALGEGHDVVGGTVENAATGTLIDWAAFLCEYSAVLPPLPAGPSTWLPGNNVVYRTGVLRRFDAVLAEHKWENRLHDAMREAGVELLMRPEITVGHKMHYTFGLYLSQRFLYSRSYAGARVAGWPKGAKLKMGAMAFALPPLVLMRTVSRIRAKRYHVDKLIRSLPLQVCFAISWGAGEIAGYWFGPGNAMARVR
ncbi:MAG: glycosyltransferase family 2 protein [Paracoccaceae bacterium]